MRDRRRSTSSPWRRTGARVSGLSSSAALRGACCTAVSGPCSWYGPASWTTSRRFSGQQKRRMAKRQPGEHLARGVDMSAVTQTIGAFPKEVVLRDCSRVLVRSLEDGDEQALLDFFLRIPEEERFFLKEDVTAPDVVDRWVRERDFRRALALVAMDGSRGVADAVLIRRRGESRSHIPEIPLLLSPHH